MIATEPGVETVPLVAKPQRWVFDSGFTGDAFAWRSHLEEPGLNPRTNLAGTAPAKSAFGQEEALPIRKAALWLKSNIPSLQGTPFRIALSPGILFRDAAEPDPEFFRPVIGMRALMRAGLKVRIDFAKARISIWTPGPWYQGVSLFCRRLDSAFSVDPTKW